MCLDRLAASLTAHCPAKALSFADGESCECDRHFEHLVLEDDDAERVAQRLVEEGMIG